MFCTWLERGSVNDPFRTLHLPGRACTRGRRFTGQSCIRPVGPGRRPGPHRDQRPTDRAAGVRSHRIAQGICQVQPKRPGYICPLCTGRIGLWLVSPPGWACRNDLLVEPGRWLNASGGRRRSGGRQWPSASKRADFQPKPIGFLSRTMPGTAKKKLSEPADYLRCATAPMLAL
jgi:hypothetical protein